MCVGGLCVGGASGGWRQVPARVHPELDLPCGTLLPSLAGLPDASGTCAHPRLTRDSSLCRVIAAAEAPCGSAVSVAGAAPSHWRGVTCLR